ncbi:MAG: hypothetical protein LBT27_09430 [Prevotellaceae bacterium]|jgi:hypothetical protein|nr:hypothetical protein [Prevotellaceae bacterium]
MKNVGIQIGKEYDIAVKVRYDAAGKIISGFVIGDVLYQNQAMLMLAHKGEIKENPLTGVGLNDICNDNNFESWKAEITEQIEGDGQRITKLELNEKGLTLDAKYV